MRRAEDDARIVNNLPSGRDAFLQHYFTKAAKITQGVMRRGHHCDSVPFRFLETQGHVIDYACVGVENQCRFDSLRNSREELGLFCFAGKLAVVAQHLHIAGQFRDVSLGVSDQADRHLREPAFANTYCNASDIIRAPGEKNDRAVGFHRGIKNRSGAGYCSPALTVASVGVANSAPLVIGATGGSGTRVVARIAKLAGYNLGTSLNSAEDALEFYSFHDKWINPFVSAERATQKMTPWQSARMKEDFHAAVARHIPEPERRAARWGWKAPRSIYLLPFLRAEFEQLKFIHL